MNIKEIQELLLAHLKESQDIRDQLTQQGTDLKWIKRIGYVIMGYLPLAEAVRHLWK